MTTRYISPRLARFLCAGSAGAMALTGASSAWAACTTTGTTVVCDTTPPNPADPVSGTNITLNSGAQVKLTDPYAGATPNFNVVTLNPGGVLNAANGSTITSSVSQTVGVYANANSTVNLNGSIALTVANGSGVSLGQGSTLNVGSAGSISVSAPSAVLVTGTGTTIQIDGTLRNSALTGSPAINLISTDSMGNTVNGTSNITIGATGQVLTSGASSPAVVLTDGSSLTVQGLAYASNNSNTIDYRGTTGQSASVTIAAGGSVQSAVLPAIVSSNGNLNLTIAGTVYTYPATSTSPVTSIRLGSGNDNVTLVTGYSVNGTIDGGGGTNSLTLTGTGSGQLGNITNFSSATFVSGSWTLTAPLSIPGGGAVISSNASVTGSASQFVTPILDNGTLVLNQASAGTLSQALLSGTGQLVKTGAGSLTVNTQSGFTGSTLVSAGQLIMAGSMGSIVTVGNGGTLAGNGTVGGIVLQSGGIVSPGTATGVGTLSVSGNYAQASGSTYAAQVIGSTADKITVTGTATLASGAGLTVTTQNASFGRYTLLSATGGVTGRYTSVQTDLTGVSYLISYASDAVYLDIGRSNQTLLALARNGNQLGVANALVGLSSGSQLYGIVGTASDDATVQSAYSQLSGDLHGAVRTAITRSVDLVTDAVLTRPQATDHGLHMWGQFLGSTGSSTGTDGAAKVSRDSYGGVLGLEGAAGKATLGLVAGYVHSRLSAGASNAGVNTPQILGYARASLDGIALQGGIGYAWARNTVTRQIGFTGFSDTDTARYNGNTLHGFGEIGVPLTLGEAAVTPFVAARVYRVATDAFTETGGAAALSGAARTHWSEMVELGARVGLALGTNLSAQSRVSWQHRFADDDAIAQLRFAAGGQDFAVQGARLSRDAGALDVGLIWTGMQRVRFDLGYRGTYGSRGSDNAGHLGLSISL